MRATKVTLRFNLNKEADRHAYEFLRGADSSYSKTAIAALNAYLDGQTQQARDLFISTMEPTMLWAKWARQKEL